MKIEFELDKQSDIAEEVPVESPIVEEKRVDSPCSTDNEEPV